jgi:uncharacterized protein YndB with AHSA1/START domain
MSDLYAALTRTDDDYAVTFERDYATSPQHLWDALTQPDRLARWFCPVDGELREGGRVTAHFDDADATFTIDLCRSPEALSVRWHHDGRDSVVRAAVFDLGGDRARLTLVHDRLTAPQAPEYAAGWHWYVDSLDGLLADREPDRTGWEPLAEHYRGEMAGVTTARG